MFTSDLLNASDPLRRPITPCRTRSRRPDGFRVTARNDKLYYTVIPAKVESWNLYCRGQRLLHVPPNGSSPPCQILVSGHPLPRRLTADHDYTGRNVPAKTCQANSDFATNDNIM